jgi:signal transduction histidine kinase
MMPSSFVPDGRSSESILSQQREANQHLLLAGLRAQEDAERALAAQQGAEARESLLLERQRELETTAERRERLIAITSHDLRNPLNTIVMAAGYLLARGTLREDDARLAKRIANSGQRIAGMLDQLVEFSRARLAGGFELQLELTNLGRLCENIADELRLSSLTDIRLTLRGELGGVWDGGRLAQVLSNLAGNAVDHARRGTAVGLEARDAGRDVIVEVTNEGDPIPPEVLPTLFKPFGGGRLTTRARSHHLGLGLYIAHEIVRAHGGTLTAASSQGTTTFALRLPRAAGLPGPRRHPG